MRLLEGYGHRPILVEGDQPAIMHRLMAAALDEAVVQIRQVQRDARTGGRGPRPAWPMIVLRTPKGWTGPAEVDGVPIEGTFRAHQVPVSQLAERPDHIAILESWMRSYRPEELFDETGEPVPELLALPPRGTRRMSANPHANGGLLLRPLTMPDFREHAVEVPAPGRSPPRPRGCWGASSATSCG